MGDSDQRSVGEMVRAASRPRRGESDFLIDRSGVWHYRGTPILREAMVRLFAAMLRRRGEEYVLHTPDQIVRIAVEDAPFIITDSTALNEGGVANIVLHTNLGESYLLSESHPLVLRAAKPAGDVRPYQITRDDIPALIHRNVYYRLVELAAADARTGRIGVQSAGGFFFLD